MSKASTRPRAPPTPRPPSTTTRIQPHLSNLSMAPTPTSRSEPVLTRSPSPSNTSILPPTSAPIEDDVKRKHGLDTSLILSEPRKRKRESTDGVGAALAAGTGAAGVGGGKKKGKETHYDEPAVVWEQGMKLLDVVRAATEGDAPE